METKSKVLGKHLSMIAVRAQPAAGIERNSSTLSFGEKATKAQWADLMSNTVVRAVRKTCRHLV